MTKTLRILALILLGVLAVNAIGGAFLLISDPSGSSIGIPIELLDGTPFSDYLIPGLILLTANGLLSLLTAILTVKKVSYYPWFLIIQGCVLVGWLTGELILNREFFHPVLHYSLYTMGMLLIVSGFIINTQAGRGERKE